MFRDISELPTAVNCIKINDDKSLIVYTNDDTSIYKLISNKYYKAETFDANTPKTEDVCYNISQISTLPSPFDFMTPIYHLSSIVSVSLIVFIAYRLILHPWWRKRA